MDLINQLSSSGNFMPHGHCYLWLPSLVWLHAASDLVVGVVYLVIPCTLVWVHRRRQDVPFRWIFVAFALFIFACGVVHLMDVWTLWVPGYWLQGGMKAVTAILSLFAGYALIRIVPEVMSMPSPARLRAEVLERRRVESLLQALNDDLEHRVHLRTTELEVTNSALRKSETQFATVFRTCPESISFSLWEDGTCVEVNEAYERLHGYARSEVIGHSALKRGLWVDPDERKKLLARLEREGRVHGFETRFRRKDGTIWTGEVSADTVMLDGKRALVAVVRDITDQKKAAAALRSSEERFSKVFRTCPETITIATLEEGIYLDVNEAFERLYGVPRTEAIGSSTLALGLWVEPERRNDLVGQLKEHRRVTGFPNLIQHRSGEIRASEISAEVIDIDGRSCLIAVVRDITERQRAEQEILRLNGELEQRILRRTAELEVANKELESFSYSVSHDLRAPLRSIHGFSEALLEDCGGQLNQDGRRHIDRIKGAADRMGHLIDDLLELSRVTRVEMARQRVDLSELARDVVRELRSAEPQRNVEVVIQEGLHATGDPRLLRVVLENLFGNAWKFTSRRDAARIEFALQPGSAELFRLQDNGAGFDMAFVTKLFGAFQRLHGANEFPGTGVGLATVHRIIRRHGGRIWAEAAVERGAVFYFTLGEAQEQT